MPPRRALLARRASKARMSRTRAYRMLRIAYGAAVLRAARIMRHRSNKHQRAAASTTASIQRSGSATANQRNKHRGVWRLA